MGARREAARGLILGLAALALVGCGRHVPAPVPETGAAISPGTPTMVLIPADAVTEPATTPALDPVSVPATDVDPNDGRVTTTPDLIGPAGDLGGGGGGAPDGVTAPETDEDGDGDEDDELEQDDLL